MTERNAFTPMQEKWLAALESGEWSQCREYLRDGHAYCCLGVATALVAPYSKAISGPADGESPGWGDGEEQTAPPVTVERMLFRCEDPGPNAIQNQLKGGRLVHKNLAGMNDDGKSFTEIAAQVRREPWLYFTNFDAPEMEASQ